MAYLRALWRFDTHKTPSLFYDDFAILNKFFNEDTAKLQALKDLQVQNLRNLYKQKGNPYNKLNEFLTQMLGTTQGTEEDLFSKLVNGINKGLNGFSRNKQHNYIQSWDTDKYYTQLNDIIQSLEKAVAQINPNGAIPAPTIDIIKSAIQNKNYDEFISAKGQYLEDIATWILQMAGLEGFNTGAWRAQDKFFNEASYNQIIEDAMALLTNNINFKGNSNNNFVTLSIVGYNDMNNQAKQTANKNLQNWIDNVLSLNGKTMANGKIKINTEISSTQDFTSLIRLLETNSSTANVQFHIDLSDNLYEQIRRLSVNIQSKSNVERHLANEGKRRIYSIEADDIMFSKLTEFNKTAPVQKRQAVSEEEYNKEYSVFSAYANFQLSRNITKTVYARNEYYLTKEGFADLATLMDKRGFLIRLADSTMSYGRFLQNNFNTIYSNVYGLK